MSDRPEPVFVTGGSGVVGGAVVRRLVDHGREVRALARGPSGVEVVRSLGAEPVVGDVLEPGSLREAMEGCDVVYHLAGVNRFCLRDPSSMHRVNVAGSANVVNVAADVGVARLVYTSSAATLGEARGLVGGEDSDHRGTFLSTYELSKFEAERRVRALARARGIDMVTVNPSSVQGPGRATGTGQLLVRYLQGRLKVWVAATVSIVDIDDCAEGHVLAEAKGLAGERYVLSGATLDGDDLMAIMRAIAPRVALPRLLPRRVAAAATMLGAAGARARGRTPIVCRESLRTLLHGHRYDGTRATRELGLQYRPAEDTLRRTAAWLVSEGLVPAHALA